MKLTQTSLIHLGVCTAHPKPLFPNHYIFDSVLCNEYNGDQSLQLFFLYGPRNLSPLKWIICSGASAIQTSVSHAMSLANFL
jgi:hypothetical protein